jgi:hypothetical protein
VRLNPHSDNLNDGLVVVHVIEDSYVTETKLPSSEWILTQQLTFPRGLRRLLGQLPHGAIDPGDSMVSW